VLTSEIKDQMHKTEVREVIGSSVIMHDVKTVCWPGGHDLWVELVEIKDFLVMCTTCRGWARIYFLGFFVFLMSPVII
jgi:hypothetical protein